MKQKKITKIVIFGILAVLVLSWVILALIPKKELYEGVNPLRDSEGYPAIIAHGGGHKEFPDNTLEAFYNAYDAEKRVMMETDVSITKDGVVILSHDIRLDRRTNVTGEIKDWNYTDLIERKVDFSYVNDIDENAEFLGADSERIKFSNDEGVKVKPTDVPNFPDGLEGRDKEVFLATTLEELICAFPENHISVEIKQSGETGKKALDSVMDLIVKYDAFDRVNLASFHKEIYKELQALKKQYANLMYSPATAGVVGYYIATTLGVGGLYGDKISLLQIPPSKAGINLATKSFVENAHKRNLAVQYWTIDDEEEMRKLIEIGADGIMTNYPHKLKKVCLEYYPE